MKVKTLIEELSKLDPDKEIAHANLDYETGYTDYTDLKILENRKNEKINMKDDFYSIEMEIS